MIPRLSARLTIRWWGRAWGGTIVFAEGLPLYECDGKIVGGLGFSGDTSCTDHVIAWQVKHKLIWMPVVQLKALISSTWIALLWTPNPVLRTNSGGSTFHPVALLMVSTGGSPVPASTSLTIMLSDGVSRDVLRRRESYPISAWDLT